MNTARKRLRFLPAALPVAVLLWTGCRAAPELPEAAAKPPVEISISIQQGSAFEGVQTDPVAREIERRFGISLDFQSLDGNQFLAQTASGELPDIVLAQRGWLKTLIGGNHILPLDDYLRFAPHVSSQQQRLAFSRAHLSEGTGKLYALSTLGGPLANQYLYDIGPNIRWDYYRELGYPEMDEPDDLLRVLKRMQDLHPETEDGRKVFGFSLWNDWGIWPFKVLHTYGNGLEQLGTMEYDSRWNARSFLLNESSAWWEGIRFYYRANRMGLLDPESFVQKYDNMRAKGANGQILATFASWTTPLNAELAGKEDDAGGFMPVPGIFPYIFHGGYSDNGNQDLLLVFTNNLTEPERAMELVDFLFSADGSRILWSGLEGMHWSKENGPARFTDEIVGQYDLADPAFSNRTGITKYHKLAGYNDATVHADGRKMSLALMSDNYPAYNRELEESYSRHYGVLYPGQLVDRWAAEGRVGLLAINTDFQVATGSVPDEIKRIDDQLIEYAGKQAPKMILASSDEEFDRILQRAIADMREIGLEQSNRYWTDVFRQTKELFIP